MQNKKIVIIGGGAAGVAAALELVQQGCLDISLIEGEERLGGLAYAFQHQGKWIHTGYHQILESDQPLLTLFKTVGLYDEISWQKCANVIYYAGKVYDLTKLSDFLKFPLSWWSKLRFIYFMLKCYTTRNWAPLENISAAEWISKVAGPEVLDKLFAPLFDIKFGLKSEEVSASWVGSRLGAKEASCRFGCLPGREWTTELFAACHQYLTARGVKIYLNTKVEAILTANGQVSGVSTSAGKFAADCVISSVAPLILSRLVELNEPKLNAITYIDSLSTIIATKMSRQQVYWLMLMQPREFAGGIFNLSNLNPTLGNNQEVILNFFTNVDHGSPLLKLSDAELLESYKKTYFQVYHEELSIEWYKVNKIPYVSAKYVRGYQNPDIKTSIAGLYLTGNYMSYPSVTSTGTAIATGIKTARFILGDI